ncbi:MAG TPA: ectoine/hydroxyectoine ABC transporter substrate-binding protein EhuB [Rhizobiaceae bacterium]|nr:ectoine/hydroxyectoine ABC transporter substrate-binding protein EhuB [Rhizobiaceae bacterium]
MTSRTSSVRGAALLAMACVLQVVHQPASAGVLEEKVKAGEPIKIGYSIDPPYAITTPSGEAAGSMNVMAIKILERMGAKVEPVVTEWGGLIPGLQASRFDVITVGMYITPNRCQSVLFSEPIGRFGDALLVLKGNPKGVTSLEQIKNSTDLKLATISGYAFVGVAAKAGIAESDLMLVQDVPAMLQALKAGRAHVGGLSKGAANELLAKTSDFEIVAEYKQDPDTFKYSGYGFRLEDETFAAAFNAELASYLGSDEMLADVAPYNYDADTIPSQDSITTAQICGRQ